jgi:hypothetical protein
MEVLCSYLLAEPLSSNGCYIVSFRGLHVTVFSFLRFYIEDGKPKILNWMAEAFLNVNPLYCFNIKKLLNLTTQCIFWPNGENRGSYSHGTQYCCLMAVVLTTATRLQPTRTVSAAIRWLMCSSCLRGSLCIRSCSSWMLQFCHVFEGFAWQ